MEEEKSLEQQVFDKILEQTMYSKDDEVYVLELDNLPFKEFTPAIKTRMQQFTSLQVLSLISCEIEDLSNWPHIPSLVRLDLVNNKIPGEDLKHLTGSRHLQTLMLSHNEIRSTEDLRPLRYMTKLSQIDLYGNELENLKDYREEVFKIFPSLKILDQEDKKGNYDDVNMKQYLEKVPSNLFEKKKVSAAQLNVMKKMSSKQNVAQAPPAKKLPPKKQQAPKKPEPKKQDKKPSPVQQQQKPRAEPKKRSQQVQGKAKGKGAYSKSRSQSTKAGLVMPVGRIGRYLKEQNKNFRVSGMSKVYLAAVMEYLCAEVVELAGNAAKSNKKTRITPKHIQLALRHDTELEQWAKDTVIADGGCVSSNFVGFDKLISKSKSSKSK